MYTIGQVAELTGLRISTLRYYDRLGLFPGMARTGGIRSFSDRELDALRMIECLKRSGLELKDIRQFMDWCAQGPSTYPQRRALFQQQRQAVEAELAHIHKVLDMLKFKCWYYEQAMADGNEDRLRAMLPDGLPEDIQRLYDHARA